jgi:peptidoglycan-associated lipoprotein
MRKEWFIIPIAVIALAGSSACATKKYVNTSVEEASQKINSRVDAVSKSVEETQEKTRQNEAKINQVDQKATTADQKATAAGQSASTAQQAADSAMTKANEADKATKKLVYQVVLSDAQGDFGFNKAALSDAMKAAIDQFVAKITADPQGSYIEVAGYTDSTGPADYNMRLGLERANAVRDYLHEKHMIPMQKISVVSYGEKDPVAPNNTKEGRAQNRRIVIKVLG